MGDWYYTANRQQLGPVSLADLRHLANQGLLKPTDLVGKDGMSNWLRASSQKGLFADTTGTAADDRGPLVAARVVEMDDNDNHPLGRSSRGPNYDDGADEDRPRRRRARRSPGGMPVGVKVGLIVGGLVLVLIVAGVGLYLLLRPSGANEIAAGLGNFPGVLGANDMRDPQTRGPSRVYTVRLIQGRTYVIDLSSQQFDSFLRLEDSAFRQVAQDDDGGGGVNGLDARIIFRCPRTDNYRVIATSLNQGAGAYTLSIRQN
jgi:hypothetical protein